MKTIISLTFLAAMVSSSFASAYALEYGYPLIQGYSAKLFCVTNDQSTLKTINPVSVCVKSDGSFETDGGCGKSILETVSFPVATAGTAYSNCQDSEDGFYCPTSSAPQPLTFNVLEYATTSTGVGADSTYVQTQVGSFQYTIPNCPN